MQAPSAPRRPHALQIHGDVRVDDWYWLRERENPDVIAYLEAENAYTAAVMEPTQALQEALFEEIRSRVQETDLSVPVAHGGWFYYTRTIEGAQHPVRCRSRTEPPDDGAAPDEVILLDDNALAAGFEFFEVENFVVSPDHTLAVYAANTDGSDHVDLRVRDLGAGSDLPDVIERVSSNVVWASDNRTVFYVVRDAALRPFRLYRHVLGTPRDEDVLVLEEPDELFRLGVSRSKCGRTIVVSIGSTTTDEAHLIDASDPASPPRVVEPRSAGVEYSVADHGEDLFIVTNADGAANFKLMRAPAATPSRALWREALPYDESVRLLAVEVFRDHLVLSERADGASRLRVVDLPAMTVREIARPEDVSTVTRGPNPEFESRTLRFHYTSLVTPPTVFDHDLRTGERRMRRRQPVLGGYDPSEYTTVREWATAPDGTRVPISIVHRNGALDDGPAPTLLYGYGSYESTAGTNPSFASWRLSLLDRGFVFAIAHARGGGEMGRPWYEAGKFLQKRNTFTDFVACAERMVEAGYSSPSTLVAQGGSAGGLLMGAVVNLRPDLFGGIVAQVPFVDVVTTMLDETIPLTVPEWEEWGNPNDPEFYAYMKSYSPYDNVEAKDYPPMLVTTGLNDTRVAFWEPAKWVAKLRATKTDTNTLLLKTQLGAGHSGPSGRYNTWRETAFAYAFILRCVGITA